MLLAEFRKSDALVTLRLPDDDRFQHVGAVIEQALQADDSKALRAASTQFLATAAKFYGVVQHQYRCAECLRLWPVNW